MVIAARGYFILHLDLIPIRYLWGFTDDGAAAIYVVKQIWNNISGAPFQKARQKLYEWFESVGESELAI